jgi:hypothetical protein
MHLDWNNASAQEIAWSVPAALAFCVTLVMIVWAVRAFAAIRKGVREAPEVYRSWGPRWNFSLLLIGAMVFFGIGWLGYVAVGMVAMLVPPPISDVSREASTALGWLLIGMETAHALAQALLWAALSALAGGTPAVPNGIRPVKKGTA